MASIIAIANGQSLRQIGWIVGVYVVVRILDDLAVAPVTIGGSVHMHPMLVLVSILVGEHTLGLLGMVAAVPLVTVIKETARLLLEHRRNLARPHVPGVRRAGRIPVYVC